MDFFLKNKMQGILTGLIKLCSLKPSRKISTLIFGQRQQAFFGDCIKARGAYVRTIAPRVVS